METTSVSINRHMDIDKNTCAHVHTHILVHTHAYNGIQLSHKKKNKILPSATWLDLEIIVLSEISQTEKDKKKILCVITYMRNLKDKTNEWK